MHDFIRFNKISGIRWLKSSVENVKIKVKLKPQDGILSLPKFEDYSKVKDPIETKDIEEYVFTWQEKVFSAWELEKYSDIHNCVTDTELNYHERLLNTACPHSKIFTYTNDDDHNITMTNEEKDPVDHTSKISLISSMIKKLNINETLKTTDEDISVRHLFKSDEQLAESFNEWTSMQIILDVSEYNEHSELILKQEAVLMSLYWNNINRCFIVSPDVNTLDWNPYTVVTRNGLRCNYEYAVNIETEHPDDSEIETREQLKQCLLKLEKKWKDKHNFLLNFVETPLAIKRRFLTIEILSAFDFEEDNLYIQYEIKIPEGAECNDSLKGKTHTSRCIKINENAVCNFAHIIELNLDSEVINSEQQSHLYMEVISRDWWGRHRTEGYAHLPIMPAPGQHYRTLRCVRPEEKDRLYADSRRFFVGGCNLLSDVQVLAKPQGLETSSFRFVSTGSVNVRWRIISQSQVVSMSDGNVQGSRESASDLLVSADVALKRYRHARATLAAAARGLHLYNKNKIDVEEDDDDVEEEAEEEDDEYED